MSENNSSSLATDSPPTPNRFDQFKWLSDYTPCFRIDANDIEILHTPTEFYAYLKNMLEHDASERIVLSSLYLGTGQLEKDLATSIESSMATNSTMRVKVLLDHSRGLRGAEANSKKMLENLISKYPSRMNLFLYHTPLLRGYRKRYMPERVNETIGVLHMKIYIADNTLIISGANLSNDYFVNRQDRYIVLKNCKSLCDFFEDLVDRISCYSFKVAADGQVEYLNTNRLEHPFLGDLHVFANGLGNSINELIKSSIANTKSISQIQQQQQPQEQILNVDENQTAFVYPLVQVNDCHIKLDEFVTSELLKRAPSSSSFAMAVGYFNLTNEYSEAILNKSKCKFEFLISSPQANGFYGSSGLSNYIPAIYSSLEEQFFNSIQSTRQTNRIRLNEYERNNWTFHAKGLWYYPANNDNLPSMTVVGSSNFGYRSVHRDLEAQLLIHSTNKKLQNKLNMVIWKNKISTTATTRKW